MIIILTSNNSELMKNDSVHRLNLNIDYDNFDLSFALTHILSDIIDCLGVIADDTDVLGDSSGSDRMITSNHDNFDTSRFTFSDGFRDVSTRGVNHSHESNEGQVFQREVY